MATYRIEAFSHQIGWFVLPSHEAHATKAVAEEWVEELARPGRRPLRLPAELRIVTNEEG